MTISKHTSMRGLFETLKNLYSRREMRIKSSWGPIFFTCTLFGLENVYDTHKTYLLERPFFSLKMFYLQKGNAEDIQYGFSCFY